MKTYYVTQEQLALIDIFKEVRLPFFKLVNSTSDKLNSLAQDIPDELDRPLLRYLGGDKTIEFKVKEPLYRLWLIDSEGDKVYFRINLYDTPSSIEDKEEAFTAPLEEVNKWKTPAWEIEKAD